MESNWGNVYNDCLQRGIEFDFVFHNSFMLKPHNEEATMDHFRSLMEWLIEKPMFINSELQENKLLTEDATIFHLGFEQDGIKQVMDASMMQMRRIYK